MGADGHWMLMRVADWTAKYPDVKPLDCGFGLTTVLGTPVVCQYWDSERDCEPLSPKYGLAERALGLHNLLDLIDKDGSNGQLCIKSAVAPHRTAKKGSRAYEGYLTSYDWTVEKSPIEADLATIEADPDLPYSKRCLEAKAWFESEAENHTLWT